jgi:dynein heavy chain
VEFNSTTKPTEFKRLLFTLRFGHACLREVLKFCPIGGNLPYEFTDTDLDISRGKLVVFLGSYDASPYQARPSSSLAWV